MEKAELLRALQIEIRRHDFDTFVDEPVTGTQGGKGVVVPGCPACRKRLYSIAQFLDHLADEVLPIIYHNKAHAMHGQQRGRSKRMEIDLHGYHPSQIVDSGVLDKRWR